MDERKRDSVITYLRRRMAEVGIKPEDLALALASEKANSDTCRYRSARGETWDGNGEMPTWLKQAINAGQSLEHFRLGPVEKQSSPLFVGKIDWRNDPFAGSPLAKANHR